MKNKEYASMFIVECRLDDDIQFSTTSNAMFWFWYSRFAGCHVASPLSALRSPVSGLFIFFWLEIMKAQHIANSA